ncbi:hypothetical protein GCM10008931_40970 [Oceanobacillus oncorhynchi subsp. oncorhynchi]
MYFYAALLCTFILPYTNDLDLSSMSLHALLYNSFILFFILIILIVIGIYISSNLLKITLTENDPDKIFKFTGIIIIYLALPILFFYNHLVPDITLWNIH